MDVDEVLAEYEGGSLSASEGALIVAEVKRLRALMPAEKSPQTATDIPLDDCGLNVNCGRDGTWLHFDAASGKSASINVEILADRQGNIIGNALSDWCGDRQKQAEQIRADNGQFGVGA